jgi:RNA-binding protein YlmH
MKERICKYFIDDDRNEALNLYERYLLSKEKDIPMFGKHFYTPNIWSWFEKNLCSKDFKVEANGFFEDAERRMISFNNIYKNPFPMKLIKIQNTSKFSNITHRDFLGV